MSGEQLLELQTQGRLLTWIDGKTPPEKNEPIVIVAQRKEGFRDIHISSGVYRNGDYQESGEINSRKLRDCYDVLFWAYLPRPECVVGGMNLASHIAQCACHANLPT